MRTPWLPGALLCAVTLGAAPVAAADGSFALPPDFPITDPDFDPAVSADARPAHGGVGTKVFYLNFDGAKMEFCGDGENDPRGNCSTIFQGAIVPYTGDQAARDAVVQAVRRDLAAYDVLITADRPTDDVDYDMEMIGQWFPAVGGGFAGVAPTIDCFDQNGGEVSFSLEFSPFPTDIAKVILQEVAHTWGLEHVDSSGDLLFPTVGGAADPVFEDKCSPIVRLGGGGVEPNTARCPTQHLEHCPTENEQNSFQDLLTLFGPAKPDATAPVLTVVAPADGDAVPNDFHLVLEIDDDLDPQQFATTIAFEGLFEQSAQLTGPGLFPIALSDIADGQWMVTVTTADEAGNSSTATLQLTVGTGVNPGADSGGSATGPGADTGDASGEGDAGQTDGGGDDGCGCRSQGRGPLRWTGLLLLWLATRRRSPDR